jgi:pilus assembly protein Flp/PilA
MNSIATFLMNEDGVTGIEYGMIAAFISIVIIVTLGLAGVSIGKVFTVISTAMAGA